jgi:hypothetical protein
MTAVTKTFFIFSNKNLSYTLNQNINKPDVLKSIFSMICEINATAHFHLQELQFSLLFDITLQLDLSKGRT